MLLALLGLVQQDYTLTTTMRLVPPYDIKAMNDEFQEATLISEKDGVGTFRITYHLFHPQQVTPNPNWRQDDAKMAEYLGPRPAANWDKELQAQILRDLRADGIDPDKLDDKTLVEQVSKWAMKRSKFNDQFGLWMVEFKDGKARVAPGLRDAFNSQEPKGKTDAERFDTELFGKSMYLKKTHGACTSSACYITTILRAIGIPTRIIVTVPAADGNDPAQVKMLAQAIRHHKTSRDVLHGISSTGFSNHLFNEVFVGGKWVRLNYTRLGQPIVDPNYEGLMTHIYTAKDLSEIPFAATWGLRFGKNEGPKLSSINPYQLLSAEDHVDDPAHFDNPPVPELTSATVTRLLKRGDAEIPAWLKLPDGVDGLICIKEWLQDDDYHQLKVFLQGAPPKFLLRADGHPDIPLTLDGGNFDDGVGTFQAFAIHLAAKAVADVEYRLVPLNEGHDHKWIVAKAITWKG